jgi:hypothetical protein
MLLKVNKYSVAGFARLRVLCGLHSRGISCAVTKLYVLDLEARNLVTAVTNKLWKSIKINNITHRRVQLTLQIDNLKRIYLEANM